MPFRPLAATRVFVLVCDDCGAVMARDGTTADKPYSASDPTELAPHYATDDELRTTGRAAGWVEAPDARWSCPRCSKPPP